MRILVTGVRGQVGFELLRSLAPLGEIVPADRRTCDLANPEALAKLVREVAPQVIVNGAAYTAVDKAETEPALAQAINGEAPGVLAREAKALGALLIHYSTDYVFNGRKDGPYTEDDPTDPLGVYGRTKLAGEQAIQAAGGEYLIFRISWVYGAHGANFAKTMLRLGRDRDVLRVVADQVGVPTSAGFVADVTALALYRRQVMGDKSLQGIYHLVPAGEVSWFGYASHLFAQARARGWPLALREVVPIPAVEYPLPAQRPMNSRMDTNRLQQALGLCFPDWRRPIEHLLDELRETR